MNIEENFFYLHLLILQILFPFWYGGSMKGRPRGSQNAGPRSRSRLKNIYSTVPVVKIALNH